MKERTPTVIIGLICLGMLITTPSHAQGTTLEATTGTGFLYGVAKEFVYNVYNNQQYTQSELDWDIEPLLMARAGLSLRTQPGFAASIDVQLGIPMKTGSISDSDWLNGAYNGDTTTITNYSHHDCYTERAVLVEAQAGWVVPLADWVTFEPFLAFDFMDFKWTARDGFLQYPPGWFGGSATLPYPSYTTDVVVPVSGTGIIYEQTWYIPGAGMQARVNLGGVTGTISFLVSPFVFCNDVDNHEFAGSDFYDTMSQGLLLEPRISLEVLIGKSRLSLDVSYRHIGGLIGNTTVVRTGVGYTPGQPAGTYTNGAGASYDALGVFLSYMWAP